MMEGASVEVVSRLLRRGIVLERFTIAWNVIEAGVAVAAGIIAGSISLLGFGLDSGIEIVAAVLVLLRLRAGVVHGEPDEVIERRFLRGVAITFIALALYLVIDGAVALARGQHPSHSAVGIVVTALALLVMPVLSIAKRRIGTTLGHRVLIAEAAESMLCAALAGATLLGLIVFTATRWAWVDPVVGFVIAAYAIKEGVEAMEGELCD
jgi:divalent metal cation (Fe/Co/Zn/Cd) transporter